MSRFIRITALILFISSHQPASFAQKAALEFEQIFKGAPTQVYKPLPEIIRWLNDNEYLEERNTGSTTTTLVVVDAKTGNATPYPSSLGSEPLPLVFEKEGDVFLLDISGKEKRLTHTPRTELNPTLAPDGKWVAFTRDNDLFALEVATAKEIRFTNDGSDSVYNGYASWVYYEEILGRSSHYKAFWWSPDSRHIGFMRFDDSQVPRFPIFSANGQHGSVEWQRYPAVGDKNPEVKTGIVSLDNTNIVWADFNEKNDQYFGEPVWSPEGKLWVQWMPRSQDTLIIFAVDPVNGGKKAVYAESQKTWIDLDQKNRVEFLPDKSGFILSSDKTGWRHLYLCDNTGKLINPITTGDFTVTDIVAVDQRSKQVFFTARKENSARTDLYKSGLNGKGMTRLSFGEYSHSIDASPGGKYFISVYGNIDTPPRMVLLSADGKRIRDLGDSKGSAFDNVDLPVTRLFRVPSADGKFNLPVTITFPLHFDSSRKYPVLISIYGGPDAGQVMDQYRNAVAPSAWWAQEGMIQVGMDNRSSGHFGKQGMNYIYRQMGKYEIEDYMQCTRWLTGKSFIDSSRICITGSSFGGYLTCMALTYGADVFTHGIAGSPVTDWQLYDTHYTERYMDTPKENPEGYRNTAVLNYAGRYKGLLRIVHGSTDDNVHIQNSLQVIDKLQDLNKHFEMMIYPGERHGIGSNHAAKGLQNRLEAYRFYYKNLLNKPMPEKMWK